MSRILVQPDLLHKLANEFDQSAQRLNIIERQCFDALEAALVDVEISKKMYFMDRWREGSAAISRITQIFEGFSRQLHQKAEEFAQADSEQNISVLDRILATGETVWTEIAQGVKQVAEAMEPAVAVVTGAMDAVTENATFGAYEGEPPEGYENFYLAGKLGGDAVSSVAGAVETLAGGTLFGGGAVLDATGVGIVPGAAANALGAGIVAHGLAFAAISAGNFGSDAKELYNNITGNFLGRTSDVDSKFSADDIRKNVTNDILDDMEANGGHLLEKHVGKTNEDLLKRAAQEGVASTTFSNKSTALRATQENIRKNAEQISDWLNNPNSKSYLITKVEHEYPVGKGVDVKNGGNSASKQVTKDLNRSQLYLVKDSSMPDGYRIVTGYPVFE